ncbi:helix-turn-helix domain-containing protein [Chryseobacterium oryctis]|uniref:Helix-turn-helix domain-containing protein n=1 Tax=Chryseobacterium oryctis TaxID=2952618 RepID=A0ABT3HRJ8_9FLAO|nr:helix-turn-helix domain-containing protein [Chryseobacterium oryctis]MCW3162413.1 helix-turn-helix domain-containing protein [Chryseobacterium oryctis]
MQFKYIHIGSEIHQRVKEYGVDIDRICKFFKCEIEDVENIYRAESIDTNSLLRWSKLLGYDFFRIYSQHLILYSPQGHSKNSASDQKQNSPQFRKNIYTKELIDFILELIESGEKTKQQIINEYKIPKTTLYKWTSKYKK